MKKFYCIILAAVLLIGTVTTAYAKDNNSNQEEKRTKIEQQLKEMDKRLGSKSEILDNVDANSLEFQFDSVEDFEKALKSIKIVPVDDDSIKDDQDNLNTRSTETVLTKDNNIYINSIKRGVIRNKIVANYFIPYDDVKRFSSVKSQTSYPYDFTVGLEWTQDNENHYIIDSGRTLGSNLNGHIKFYISIGGYPIGTVEDYDFENIWDDKDI